MNGMGGPGGSGRPERRGGSGADMQGGFGVSGRPGEIRNPGRHGHPGGPGWGGGRGPGMMGMPVQKPKHFKTTLRRLLSYLRPHTAALVFVFVTAALSTVFAVVSPKILGNATTVLAKGMYGILTGQEGAGIDFPRIGEILLQLAALYVISALFAYAQQYVMAGVVQKLVYELR